MLLCQTVNRAKTDRKFTGRDRNHLALRKQAAQGAKRDRVVGAIEGRHENRAIGDVEISVRSWQPCTPIIDRGRHRQSLNLKRAAVLVAHR